MMKSGILKKQSLCVRHVLKQRCFLKNTVDMKTQDTKLFVMQLFAFASSFLVGSKNSVHYRLKGYLVTVSQQMLIAHATEDASSSQSPY